MNSTDKSRVDMEALERAENAEQTGRCQLWERQPGETEKAYSAFRIYRDLAERRTLAKVAQTLGCSSTNVERWARRWFWTNRVYQHDLVEEEKWREQASRDRIAMRRRQVQLGQVLQSIAAYAVQEWRQRIEQRLPLDLRPDEVLAMLKLGSELESKGNGEEKEGGKYTRIVVNFGGMSAEAFDAKQYETLSDAEKAAEAAWRDPPKKKLI